MKTVLVIDDTPDNLLLISNLLEKDYLVKVATSGMRGLKIAQSNPPPDIILLDIMMPEMDGYEVCKILKEDDRTKDIPIIFLTAKITVEDETKAFSLGAVDYITKPIFPPVVQARLKAQLQLKETADFLKLTAEFIEEKATFLKGKAEYLEEEVASRTREIAAIQDVTILAMASLAETRDSDTGNHIRRTQYYVEVLATKLRDHSRFSHYLNDQTIKTLFKSAPLHDIGKVGIPDRILLKPGRFEPHEMEIMKTHTTLGRDAIQHAEDSLGIEVEFLKTAKEIAYGHQEKWDGSGYPEGLAGDDIPISARLMAVADVYDALISRRVYKDGMPHEKAVHIIQEGKGKHFDPDMVEAFLQLHEEFRMIAFRFADSDDDMQKKADYLAKAIIEGEAGQLPGVQPPGNVSI